MAPAIVTALVLMFGWRIVENHARRREQRADLRSAVLSLSDAVSEVRNAAKIFYCLSGNDPQAMTLAATIRSKIMSLANQLAILKIAGLTIDSDELLKRFRQSVTGGNFDSLNRPPLTENSTAFLKINADGESLSREVHIAMLRVLLVSKNEENTKSSKRILSRLPLSQPELR